MWIYFVYGQYAHSYTATLNVTRIALRCVRRKLYTTATSFRIYKKIVTLATTFALLEPLKTRTITHKTEQTRQKRGDFAKEIISVLDDTA